MTSCFYVTEKQRRVQNVKWFPVDLFLLKKILCQLLLLSNIRLVFGLAFWLSLDFFSLAIFELHITSLLPLVQVFFF